MSDIAFIDSPINRKRLKEIAQQRFGDLVKGVVDIKKEVIALGGELHADEEAFLMNQGSTQSDLWGINLYPDLNMPDMLEFDSMINIRPTKNNSSRGVEDPALQQKIADIINKLIID